MLTPEREAEIVAGNRRAKSHAVRDLLAELARLRTAGHGERVTLLRPCSIESPCACCEHNDASLTGTWAQGRAILEAANKMLIHPSLIRCYLVIDDSGCEWRADWIGPSPRGCERASGTGPDPVAALDAMMNRACSVNSIQRQIRAEGAQ